MSKLRHSRRNSHKLCKSSLCLSRDIFDRHFHRVSCDRKKNKDGICQRTKQVKFYFILSLEIDLEGDIPITEKLLITALHISACFFLYLVMYFVMTYNAWIIISTLLGNFFGYFIFSSASKLAKERASSNVGCCHAG